MLTVRIIAPRCAVFCQDIVGKRHVSRRVFEREMYAFTGILERTVLRSRSVQVQKLFGSLREIEITQFGIIQMPYPELKKAENVFLILDASHLYISYV